MDIESMAKYWTEDSDNYGKIIADELRSFRFEEWQKLFREKLPPKARRVLDVGCGPGFFSILLAKMGYDVTAIDCSEGMLAKARMLSEQMGAEVGFHQMDAAEMEFESDSFDAIVSRNVTWTLADPWKVYDECRRVLKFPGRLLIFDANWHLPLYDEASRQRAEARRQECLEKHGDDYEDENIEEPIEVMALPLSGVKRPYWDVEVLRLLGFRNVQAEMDMTERLWDEKEKLLYGETPLFGVMADK